MGFIEPTEISGIDNAIALLQQSSSNQGAVHLLSPTVRGGDVARAWSALIEADLAKVVRDSANRNLTLVAILAAFERLRRTRYNELRSALATLLTKTGRPMTVLGTRCELASRAAEGIYSEVRRTPTQAGATELLTFVESALTAVLTDCRQREIPSYVKRWRGIRGVSRLMITVHSGVDSPQQLAGYLAASDDLETAFKLGNRGPSAAAYLLDCLYHVIEHAQTQEAFDRFSAAAVALNDDERKSRTVLTQLGRYAFARSFHDSNSLMLLQEAVERLTTALSFPQDLATDDAFVRLIRGQALIRISMAYSDSSSTDSLAALSAGIEDLKFAIESPGSIHKQISLQPALITRAKQFLRERRYSDARADLAYLLANPGLRLTDTANAAQAEFIELQVTLREAIESDDQHTLAATLSTVLAHSLLPSQGLVSAAMAAKHLYFNKDASYDPELLHRTLEALEAVDTSTIEDTRTRRMHLGLKGRLYLMYGLVWHSEALQQAANACRQARDCCDVPPDSALLALHGETLLQFAKHNLQHGGPTEASIDALEQAAEYFREAAEVSATPIGDTGEWFQVEVSHSKAGESYHRLFGITGVLEHARCAVESFEQSLNLGNNSPALLGLLGDAYYRIFRLTREPAMLALAISNKQASREAGHASRENLSLSAKLAFIAWESSCEPVHLSDAIKFCAEAHELSPSWPWPPFQLAEIVEDVSQETIQAAVERIEPRRYRLIELLRQGQAELIGYGCQLVVRDDEFQKKSLGGRQPVYVLEDPHRLLSASYVFKHTSAKSANRDRDVIEAFLQFLRRERITGLGLPTPVAIISQGTSDNAVYVMRRAPGIDLGRLLLRNQVDGAGAPLLEYERALGYLSAFHAWGAEIRPAPAIQVRQFVRAHLLDLLGHGFPVAETAQLELEALGTVPCVLKKDAHPENWLIDDRQRIWMLDFESSKGLPLPFEVVQLVDDYPLLPPTDIGWAQRMTLCRNYLNEMERLSGDNTVSRSEAELLYAYFLVLRSTFGYLHCRRRLRVRPASSAQRASSARLAHHQALLSWLSTSHSSQGVRDLASAVTRLPAFTLQ